MKLKFPLRRTAVLAAGALIGLSGAFALAGPASAHHNFVKGKATCVAGEWVVDWEVQAVGTTPKYKWTKVALTPSDTTIDNADLAVNGKELDNNKVLTGKQHVPATKTGSSLTVAAEWPSGKAEATGEVTFEGECKTTASTPPSTPASTPPSTPPAIPSDLPGEPEPIYEADCDTLTIGLDNPVDGVKFTLKFKTSKGEQRTLVIKPGEKKSETFSATEGFEVDVTFTATVEGKDYSETTTVGYVQPDDCDSSGDGGGLPLTGAAAGSIAGGAGALLAVGAGLFFMARRRKVKFTA